MHPKCHTAVHKGQGSTTHRGKAMWLAMRLVNASLQIWPSPRLLFIPPNSPQWSSECLIVHEGHWAIRQCIVHIVEAPIEMHRALCLIDVNQLLHMAHGTTPEDTLMGRNHDVLEKIVMHVYACTCICRACDRGSGHENKTNTLRMQCRARACMSCSRDAASQIREVPPKALYIF